MCMAVCTKVVGFFFHAGVGRCPLIIHYTLHNNSVPVLSSLLLTIFVSVLRS
jgi:hypothetical protein